MRRGEGTPRREQGVGAQPEHGGQLVVELVRGADLDRENSEAQRGRRGLRLPQDYDRGWKRRIGQHRDAGHPGGNLLEEFQAFADEVGTDQGQPRDVRARSGNTVDKSKRDRVIVYRHHKKGNTTGCVLGGTGRNIRRGHNDVRIEPDQLSSEAGQPADFATSIPVFE